MEARSKHTKELIDALHAEYRRVVPDCPPIEHPAGQYDWKHVAWRTWLQRGWNLDDLRCVLAYIQHEIKNNGWSHSALPFQRLIKDDRNFEGKLQAARAWSRDRAKPKERPQARALREWRGLPEGEPKVEAKQVGRLLPEYIAKMRAAVDGGTQA